MKTTREILLGCVLIALVGLLLQGCFVLEDLRLTVQQSTKAVQGVDLFRLTLQSQLAGKYGMLAEATAAARESRKTIDVLQQTSLAERKKVEQLSDASIEAVRDLDAVARSGATAVQGLGQAVAGLGSTTAALQADAEAAHRTIEGATALVSTLNDGARSALDKTTETISHADALVVAASPIEDYVRSTSRHLDAGSKSIEETLAFLRDDFAPKKASFWMKLANAATGGAVAVLLHLWPVQRVHEVR